MSRSPASSPRWKRRSAGLRARMVGVQSTSLRGERVTLGRLGGARVALAVTGRRRAQRPPRTGRAAGGLSPESAHRRGRRGRPEPDPGRRHAGHREPGHQRGGWRRLRRRRCAGRCGRDGVPGPARGRGHGDADRGHSRTRSDVCWLSPSAGSNPADGDADPSRLPDVAAVVDLESAAFAAAATRAGLPWVVLRAVSDTAADSVPALLNRSRDDGGAVRRGSVLRGLLTNPRALRPLLELRERVRLCAGRLADAVEMTMLGLAGGRRARHSSDRRRARRRAHGCTEEGVRPNGD